MSLTVSLELDRSSRLTAGVVSFIEAVVFCFISSAFLIGGVMLSALGNQPADAAAPMSFGGWLGGMSAPVAALALLAWAALYIVFILLYWAPPVVETAEGRRVHDYRRSFVAFGKVAAFWAISAGYFAAVWACGNALASVGAMLRRAATGTEGAVAMPGWFWCAAAFVYYLFVSAYWSRLGMPGIEITRVSGLFLGVLTLLAAAVVVYYVLVAGAYVLVGRVMGAEYTGRPWNVGDWLAHLQTTVAVLATIVLALIGLFYFRREQAPRLTGVLARLFGPLLPLGKAAFFLMVSAASLVGFVAVFGMLFEGGESVTWSASGDLGRSLGLVSAAAMAALAGGYLLLITAYWVPGRHESNIIELSGFSVLLAMGAVFALLALGIYLSTLDAWWAFLFQGADNLGLHSLRQPMERLREFLENLRG